MGSLSVTVSLLLYLPCILCYSVSDGSPPPPPSCTNTSTYDPVRWEESEESCCITRIVEPECTLTSQKVCTNLAETKCEAETWQECTMTDCPVQVTLPEHIPNSFTPWQCNDVWVNVTHHKRRPVEFLNHKEVCDEIWLMNDDGEKYSGGKENCKNQTWTDFKYEYYEKLVEEKQSECVELPPITYYSCANTARTSVQKCTVCEARILPKCETSIREYCTDVQVKTCKPQSVTDCDWKWQIPSQKFNLKKRCFNHNQEEDSYPAPRSDEVPHEEDA